MSSKFYVTRGEGRIVGLFSDPMTATNWGHDYNNIHRAAINWHVYEVEAPTPISYCTDVRTEEEVAASQSLIDAGVKPAPRLVINAAQRHALEKVYDRGPVYHDKPKHSTLGGRRMTFLEFMNSVQPTFGCDGAVVVKWQGMYLAIEQDGYTHS